MVKRNIPTFLKKRRNKEKLDNSKKKRYNKNRKSGEHIGGVCVLIKLIVSDLDGTLLPKGETEIDGKTFEMLSKAAKRGVAFAVASGRAYHELKRFFRHADCDIYYIASDGALTVFREQSLFAHEIPKTFLPRIAFAARQRGLAAVFIGKYLSYYADASVSFAQRFHRERHQHVLKVDSLSEIREPVFKISFYGTRSAELPSDLMQNFSRVYEGGDWVDFVRSGVNKGSALTALREMLGIAADEVLAFGDNDNDAEMLAAVPNSCAMVRSTPKALAAANIQTDHVVNTIRGIVLKEKD